MFQFNPELLKIIQKYQELIKNSHFKETSTTFIYGFRTTLAILTLAILFCLLDVIQRRIFKKITIPHKLFDKISITLLIIALVPFTIAIINGFKASDMQNQITNSVIKTYNIKHESDNPLKEFDEKWLKAIMIDPKIENSTLFKTKKVFEYRDKAKPPSVKYMQIEPAPEGDAPMVETQVVTKNELTKPNSQPIYPDDVQLIKIEKKNDTTLITTHIKINNQWYKTQLQEYLLDLILDGETQQYYDDAQGKILVGV